MSRQNGSPASHDMVLAWIQLTAVLPLFERLVAYDDEARAAIDGHNLVLQFEVKDGPVAHLRLADGAIEYGAGPHGRPDVRMTFKTPDLLNRLFDGEDVRPGIRKGLRHVRFLTGGFAVLSDRLRHHMDLDGPTPGDEAHLRFLVDMRMGTMLAGTAAIANHDGFLRPVADGAPMGSMHLRVLPDGPRGSLTNHGTEGWSGGWSTAGEVNALIELDSLEGARRLVYEETTVENMAGLGEARITGNLLLAEKASELITRFLSVMDG